MDEKRNVIDDLKSMARNRTGEEMTTDQILNDFRLFGPSARADMLDQLDKEYQAMEVESDEASIKKYAQFTTFRTDMQDIHHKLRKAGR